MAGKQWLFVAPTLLLLGGGGWKLAVSEHRATDGRIVTQETLDLEQRLGRHLYAPVWLPAGTRPGMVREGAKRILMDYTTGDQRSLFILAQEPRNQDRDAYHTRKFIKPADSQTLLAEGRKGYFVTGVNGERRLFWVTADTAVIVSSTMLADEDLARLAQSVR